MPQLTDKQKWETLFGGGSRAAEAQVPEVESSGKITAEMGVAYMVEIVSQLGSDGAADLLRSLPKEFASAVLCGLPADREKELREILAYAPGTAGAVMAKEFLYVPSEATVADAVAFLHRIPAAKKGRVPYVYVTDSQDKLQGVVRVRDLILNATETPIREIASAPVVSVGVGTSQDEVARVIQDRRFLAVPVTDSLGRMVGVVSADNMIQAVKDQADRDIAQIVGTGAEELRSQSIPRIMRLRLPWLLMSILSGLLCAWISGIFQSDAGTVAALFLFVPVVLGLSESTGIQGATIVIRNMTLGSISPRAFGMLVFRELIVGLLIGLVCGLIVGSVAYFWQGNPVLGIALASSMNAAILVSAGVGLLLPVLFRAIKIDPAFASGPLVLALCDIQTLLIYFNLSRALLSR